MFPRWITESAEPRRKPLHPDTVSYRILSATIWAGAIVILCFHGCHWLSAESVAPNSPQPSTTITGAGAAGPTVIVPPMATSAPALLYRVSAYCPCRLCCGPRACGITASGTRADHPLVAAPPEIPFGVRLAIPGYGTVRVEDRGAAIQGKRLDILFSRHKQAVAWGVKFLKVRAN